MQRAIAIALSSLLVAIGATAMSAEAPEYQIKAAMLYHLALFVEWPPHAFPADTSPFVLCVLGDDPFGPWLDYELVGTYVGTHPIEIRRIANVHEASRCHVVFASRSEEPRMQKYLTELRNSPVLSVSDVADATAFCRAGGMVDFLPKDSTIGFALNSEAMARAGLRCDSRVKRLAVTAECGKGQ